MILKNRTQESAHFSKSNNFIGLAFVMLIIIPILVYLHVPMIYAILPIAWIVIEIFITIKNIKKGQSLNHSGINEVVISDNNIKLKSNKGNIIEYSYEKLKQINIQIETYICNAGGRSLITSIKSTKIDFIFNNNDIKTINIYCYTRFGFINKIKKIIKSLKNKTTVNITYIGSGNMSDIKEHIEFYKKHNRSKLLNKSDSKNILELAITTAIFGPILILFFAYITMKDLVLMDYILLFLKSILLFSIIAFVISSPVIIDKVINK